MKVVTGWQLCKLVEKKLTEEPQNYCQLTWEVHPEYRSELEMPEGRNCGTAYCIGGWMRQFLGAEKMVEVSEKLQLNWSALMSTLFSASACGIPGVDTGPIPGTPEYAQKGIKHLKKWMANNRVHLNNIRVKVNASI